MADLTGRRPPPLATAAVVALALAVALFTRHLALARADAMLWPWGQDLAWFMQRAWQVFADPEGGRTLLMNEMGRGPHAGRHHSPIVSAFAPAMALSPNLRTMLTVQAAFVGAAVLPLAAVAWRCSERVFPAALLLAAALSTPAFLPIGFGDLRLVAPALALVPALVGFAVFGSWPGMLAATVLACAVREEVAVLVIAALPFLAWERHQRGGSLRPLLAVAIPALLWHLGTTWRATLLAGGLESTFAGAGIGDLLRDPGTVMQVLGADLRGELAEPPRFLVRTLLALGATGALMLRKPLALLPLGAYWLGACLHAGVVNAHQLHYYAPLVGFAAAVAPLALGATRRLGLAAAALVLVLNVSLPAFDGPVRIDETLSMTDAPAPPWELAARVGRHEPALVSDWVAPLLPPRELLWMDQDLRDARWGVYRRIQVALLQDNAPAVEELLALGWREEARAGGVVLLRPTSPSAEAAPRTGASP